MSDGPHRSLPMRRAYKKVAQVAYNENFDVQEVVALLAHALVGDVRKDVPFTALAVLQGRFQEGEQDLFPGQGEIDLSNARRLVDGSPMGALVLDCANAELSAGNVGQKGLFTALEAAFRDRALRAARQIEEHYERHPEASKPRTVRMRQRLDQAITKLDTSNMARQALGDKSVPLAKAARHQGLDEGVPLS